MKIRHQKRRLYARIKIRPFVYFIYGDNGYFDALRKPVPITPEERKSLFTGEIGRIDGGFRFITTPLRSKNEEGN